MGLNKNKATIQELHFEVDNSYFFDCKSEIFWRIAEVTKENLTKTGEKRHLMGEMWVSEWLPFFNP